MVCHQLVQEEAPVVVHQLVQEEAVAVVHQLQAGKMVGVDGAVCTVVVEWAVVGVDGPVGKMVGVDGAALQEVGR